MSNLSRQNSSLMSRSMSAKSNSVKTEQFYIGGKQNAKGLVYSKLPTPKSIRKSIPIITIADKEENLTTKEVNMQTKIKNVFRPCPKT